jgi:hypothetical protein
MICYKSTSWMQGRRPFVRAINRFVLIVTITVTLAQPVSPQSSLPATRAWGPSTNGLRIAISTTSTTPPSTSLEFLISIQNISNRDFVVNLGWMLGNGKVMFPEAVRLSLTDPAGETRELRFFDRRYPAIAGRLDDFTVALRAGAAYEFPVSLDQYWSESTKEFGMKLGAGRYRIQAWFEGRGATNLNLDTPGIGLMNFWKGTAQSNTLEFEVSPR